MNVKELSPRVYFVVIIIFFLFSIKHHIISTIPLTPDFSTFPLQNPSITTLTLLYTNPSLKQPKVPTLSAVLNFWQPISNFLNQALASILTHKDSKSPKPYIPPMQTLKT